MAKFFDDKKFEEELGEIKSPLTTPLKMALCVVCGTLGSSINFGDFINNLYGNGLPACDEDTVIVIDLQETDNGSVIKHKHIIKPTVSLTMAKILKKNYPLQDGFIRFVHKPISKKSKNKKKKGNDTFYNCIKIEFKNKDNNISTKLFPNGKIQIAGCRTIHMANVISNNIKEIVEKYGKEAILSPQSYGLENVRIGMINTNCSFHKNICRDSLKDYINKNSVLKGGRWRKADFDPEIYPGVNAKHWGQETVEKYFSILEGTAPDYKNGKKRRVPTKVDGQTAVLVFRSGKVIITGSKTLEQLRDAYNDLVSIVAKYEEHILYDDDSDDEED